MNFTLFHFTATPPGHNFQKDVFLCFIPWYHPGSTKILLYPVHIICYFESIGILYNPNFDRIVLKKGDLGGEGEISAANAFDGRLA